MEKLKQLIEQLQERINRRSLRERAILFVVITFVLYSLFDHLLLTPLKLQQQALLQQIQTIQAETSQFESLALATINRSGTDPDKAKKQQLNRLNQQLDAANNKIAVAVAGLIPPEKMAMALENLLQKRQGLEFVSIENLPAEPLIDTPPNISTEETTTPSETIATEGIYRHGFRLQFEGNYLDTLAYLRDLESLKWRFRWDDLDLIMLDYPVVRVTIMLHTISLDEGVIGV